MSYTYSPELKAPQKMPEIDPGKPAMAGMLRILRLTHQKQTGAFQPPPGLKCHTIPIPSGAENDIPCFVIEPENAASVLPAVLMIHGGGFGHRRLCFATSGKQRILSCCQQFK